MSSNSPSALQAEINRLQLALHTLQKEKGTEFITVADYILKRLEQLNVNRIFGVPGDFNLGFLDYIEDHPTIDWVGNCNELNAAYAADGYARVKEHSVGVLVTTFGVGELSAINGVAGAFSEMVPILHIVGVPNTTHQKTKPMLHHTLGDGRYDAYRKSAAQVTFSQMDIKNKEEAASKIDQSLTNAITRARHSCSVKCHNLTQYCQARPVYLTLPTDLVIAKISSERLKIPLSRDPPVNDPAVEDYVLELVIKLFAEAEGDAVVLVDACAIRHDVRNELKGFCLKTGFPVYSAPMGKTAVDENYERYGGIYLGSISHPDIKEKVEGARLILSVGSVLSDFNTGNFSYNIPTKHTVELHSDHTKVQYARFPGIGMKHFLPRLTEKLAIYHDTASKIPVPKFALDVPKEDNEVISHTYFWPRVGKFFRPKDVIVTETGTPNFGISDVPLPKESVLVSQILWGSIGWSVGSALGAALAAQEFGKGRTILFVGDGSLQLTVQEISTMMRKGATPIIFVLNNRGYTIERYIHGKQRKYNDISEWDYPSLLNVLGHRDGMKAHSYTVNNKQELDQLLDNATFAKADCVQLVEVMMDALDAPRALQVQAEMSGKINAYEAAAQEGMDKATTTTIEKVL